VQIKSFTSRENVDRWTKKADWDVVLTNVKIVVSTYAVLHEALFHAFIKIESLALIVFDEGQLNVFLNQLQNFSYIDSP
jgi:hypothetical protein